MVEILRRIFIKNYKDVENQKVRTEHGKLAAAFGIFSNIILFAIKLVAGFLSSSISIITDSINNLSDFANSTITLIGFKISGKPADKEHPFGHERIEYITGLIVSCIIVALAVLLLYQSIDKIISGTPVDSTWFVLSVIILGISVFLKLLQAYFNFKMSKIINSVALKATALDSLTDSIATTLLLVSAVLSKLFGWNLDGYMGCLVSLFVGYAGFKMIKETSSPLVGEASNYEDVVKIVKEIESYEGVLGIHDLVAHNYGPTKIFMTVHVEVDACVDVMKSHELIDQIEIDIRNKYGIELTIHLDPIDLSNPETKRLKEKARAVLKEIDETFTLHDFRVVHGEKHSNVLFDVVVPFEATIKEEEIKSLLTKKMNEGETKIINLVLQFDRPFVEK